jgi:glucosamine 6-phosphate synthetase-like amidotransferase/phosphosugar isomerase protein
MPAPAELRRFPQLLGEMLPRLRPAYESALRETRWGEGPVWVLASGSSLAAGLTARYAFEELLGWPTIVREPLPFLAYSLPALRTGSVVVIIDSSGECAQALEAAQAVRKRGAQVLALTSHEEGPLTRLAGQRFLLPATGSASEGALAGACLEHAVLSYVALVAARLFKRPGSTIEKIEKDWEGLPRHLEWIANQLGAAVASLATDLKSFAKVFLVGGGFYHPAAARAVALRERGSRPPAHGFDLAEFASMGFGALDPETAVVLLGGSRCRVKASLGELAGNIRKRRAGAFAVTDSNDRELIRNVGMTLLIPELAELPAAILVLALAGWMVRELGDRRETLGGPGAGAYSGEESHRAS